MAKYLILIYGDEQQWNAMSPEEEQRIGDGHRAFGAAAGVGVLAGHQLEATSLATTLRMGSGGHLAITDGPFAETKEVLGGYYLLEAADLDEAIALSSRLHEVTAGHSGVEIRPVVEHG